MTDSAATDTRRNWAGNINYQAAEQYFPNSVDEVQELVRVQPSIRALGSRHSFNAIADTPGVQLSLERLNPTVQIDPLHHTATVAGGVRYGHLCAFLDEAGYALPNLASLPHISVAGAVATATHGSGEGNGCLSSSVAGLEMVTADGSLLTVQRDSTADFAGMVVALGALGLVTHVTLDLLPTFAVRQFVYERLPFAQALAHFDAIIASGYSVSFFTDWRSDAINQLWLKQRVTDQEAAEAAPELFGARLATGDRHPIGDLSPVNCTAQMGVAGPWYDRLPHFRMAFTPSSGQELQTEYLVPRRHALAALEAVNGLRSRIAPLLQISEIRLIAADDLWLSPFYQQDSVGIHFTWQPQWPAVQALLPDIEAALLPFDARPHWGKLFTMPGAHVQSLYPKLAAFRALRDQYDPAGKFRNPFIDTYLYDRA